MKVDPFIEAEKVAGHNVAKACELLEVSRAAFYQRRNGAPSQRAVTDAELLEQIRAIHDESKGTYGAPRVHKELLHRHVAAGKRKVTRLMRQAGLEGRCKKRWRTTTVADPGAEAARDLIGRHFGPGPRWTGAMSGTSPTSRPGRAGPIWPRSSTWPAAGLLAGLWPITCAPSWSRTPSSWPSNKEHLRRASLFIPTGAVKLLVPLVCSAVAARDVADAGKLRSPGGHRSGSGIRSSGSGPESPRGCRVRMRHCRWGCHPPLGVGGSVKLAEATHHECSVVRPLPVPCRARGIAILVAKGCGVREIARQIKHDPGTISRELRRNAATRPDSSGYRAITAQWHADRRAKRPKVAKLAANEAHEAMSKIG